MAAIISDEFEKSDRVYLEKLRLATTVILELSQDDKINSVLETELYLLRDRLDRALLHPATSVGILPGHDPADSADSAPEPPARSAL